MHEMALMGDLLDLVVQDATKRGFTRIDSIELTVGELSNALPDALMLAFDVYKGQDIPLVQKDATLTITMEKAHAQCVMCGTTYVPEQKLALCPSCHLPTGKLTSGETLRIETYEGS